MRSVHLARVGAVLLLLAAVLVVSACGCSRVTTGGPGVARQSQPASGAADASSSAAATSGSDAQDASGSASGGSATTPVRKPLSASDVQAIDAELSAIEKELDSMALPSDSDFGGIESGLE